MPYVFGVKRNVSEARQSVRVNILNRKPSDTSEWEIN